MSSILHRLGLCLFVLFVSISSVSAQINDTIYTDTTFLAANNPHLIVNTNLFLDTGVVMTIEPGAVLQFDQNSGITMQENSQVLAEGTLTDSIFLQSSSPGNNWRGIQGEFSPFDEPTPGLIKLTYVHASAANNLARDIIELDIDHCYVHEGGLIASGFTFGSTEKTVRIDSSRIMNMNGVLFSIENFAIRDSYFENISGSVVNEAYSITAAYYDSKPVQNCQFINVGTGFTETLEGVAIEDCYFENCGIVARPDQGLFFSMRNCTAINCDSVIVGLGGKDDAIVNNTFTNNLLGVSWKEGYSPFAFSFFHDNNIFDNVVDVRISTSDSIILENNCWGETDSASIVANFVIDPGITPDFALSPFSINCIPGLVFPGDTDHDQVCDLSDLFPIGIYFGQNGPTRPNATLNWEGQLAPDWTDTLANGQNLKHADADGDGMINSNDTAAIFLNYGQTHDNLRLAGFRQTDGPSISIEALPGLLTEGQTYMLAVSLGSADTLVNDLYGLFFELEYDPNLIQNIAVSANNSWAGSVGQDLLLMGLNANNRYGVTMVRTDQSPASGFGQIAELAITMADSLPDNFTFDLTFTKQEGVELDETVIELSGNSLSQDVVGVGVNLEIELVQGISLFPNPAAQMVRFRSEQALINSIRILNLNGKPVLESTVGSYQHQQDLSRLATGLYLIEVQTSEGVWRQKLIKQ